MKAAVAVVVGLLVAAVACTPRAEHRSSDVERVDVVRVTPTEASRGALRDEPTTTTTRAATATTAVARPAERHLAAANRTSVASWYGPGFFGHRTACGQVLTPDLVGAAHRTLPCGTAVVFRHGAAVVTAPVIDRGPYVAGREWDLSAALCRMLAHCWTGPIESTVAR